MVIVLDSEASGLGSSPGWGNCVVFWARHFTLTVPLSTQVHKWVPTNLMLGTNLTHDELASHPGRSRNTPSRFMLLKPG